MSKPNELKPCPFCGGRADLCDADSLYSGHDDDLEAYRVICLDCSAELSDCGEDYPSAEKAIAAWNMREVAPPEAREEEAQVELEIERLAHDLRAGKIIVEQDGGAYFRHDLDPLRAEIVIRDTFAALRSRPSPQEVADAPRAMRDDEVCKNYECPHFDMDCDQNCGGALDEIESPAAEFCTKWPGPAAPQPSPQIDDLLLQEIFSLREKLKIAVEAIKSYEPDFDAQLFMHRLGSVDYEQLMEELGAEPSAQGADNSEKPNKPSPQGEDDEAFKIALWQLDEIIKTGAAQKIYKDKAIALRARLASADSSARELREWQRGYFCAVAKLITLEGVMDSSARELFGAGGDWRNADPEDRAVFEKHGAALERSKEEGK